MNDTLPSLLNIDRRNVADTFQNTTIKESIDYLSKYFYNIKNDIEFLSGNLYKDEDFSQNSLKRVSAKNCNFDICLFTRVAATGSIWSGTQFIDCDLSNANFEFCDFSHSHFLTQINNIKTKIEGSNFSSSNFSDANLNNIQIIGSSFTNVNFSNATIINCNIRSSTFENSIFKNTTLKDLKLSNLNFEYVDLRDSILENIEFSFMQFAYIIGIKKEDIYSGKIKITANNNVLSEKDLNKTIQHLVVYFSHKNNYFPLLNLILIFDLDKKMFKKYMSLATNFVITDGNYRLLKYLTKLIDISKYYSREEKQNLFDYIQSQQNNTSFYHQSYLKHKSEIELFLVPQKKEDLVLEFKSLANFTFDILSKIIKYYSKAKIVLEIIDLIFSQNSPVKLKVILNNYKTELSLFLQFTAVVFAGISAFHSQFPDSERILTQDQEKIAITVNNNYINNIKVENVLIRENSNNLLIYKVENSPLQINHTNINKLLHTQ